MPHNVATAYPMFPTRMLGTTSELQPAVDAKAAAVAGPPMAAEEATSSRCITNAPTLLPQTAWIAANSIPCIE